MIGCNGTMGGGPDKGPAWDCFIIIDSSKPSDPEVACKYCHWRGHAGGSRMAAHVLRQKGKGIACCTANVPPDVLQKITLHRTTQAGSARRRCVAWMRGPAGGPLTPPAPWHPWTVTASASSRSGKRWTGVGRRRYARFARSYRFGLQRLTLSGWHCFPSLVQKHAVNTT